MRNVKEGRFWGRVRLLPIGGLLVASLSTAPAVLAEVPEAETVSLPTISVTGSRLGLEQAELAQPLLRLDRSQIERSGYTNLGEILQNMSVAGSAVNASVVTDIANAAGTEFNLRHLGSDRTLVLVNGRRWLGGVGIFRTSTPDLSAIPLAIVERVELLLDGASAVYGTDAVGGVVNIITRRDFEGFEWASTAAQFLGHGDGRAMQTGLSYGRTSKRGHLFASLSYGDDGGIQARDRALSQSPVFGSGVSRGNAYNQQGRFLFVPDPNRVELPCAQAGFCDLTLIEGEDGRQQSDFRPYVPEEDNFNYSLDYPLSLKSDRWGLFASASGEMAGGVSISAEAFAARRETRQPFPDFLGAFIVGDLGAPPPYSELHVAADNPFNPFGQVIGAADPTTFVGLGSVLRIAPERGDAGFAYTVTDQRLALTLGSDAGVGLAWELGAIGAFSDNEMLSDDLSLSKLALGLGPAADCQADPDCVPVNLFGGLGVDGQGSLTPAMLAYVSRRGHFDTDNRSLQFFAQIRQELLALPGGPVRAAYGIEYRRERYHFIPDTLTQQGDSLFGILLPGRGRQSVVDAFVELAVPLSRRFDLNLALRRSDYAGRSAVNNGRLNLLWEVRDGLYWRGTASEAFRVAPLGLQYFGGGPLYVTVDDPCSQWGQSDDQNLQRNCQADGVPADYQQPDGLSLFFNRGNVELEPEESTTLSTGLVLRPASWPGFSLSLDWYRVDLDNTISQFLPQFVLDACYRQAEPGLTCPLIERNETSGGLRQVDLPYANLDRSRVRGLDLAMRWLITGNPALGRVELNVTASRLYEYTDVVRQSDGSRQRDERTGTNEGTIAGVAFPKLRATAHLGWAKAKLRAGWTLRGISALTERCSDGVEPSLTELGLCSDPDNPEGPRNKLASTVFHDLYLGYRFSASELDLIVGVNNAFDKEPPVAVSGVLASFNTSVYDIPGRYGFIRLNWKF